MTADQLKLEIEKLHDVSVPIQVRDQYGGVLEVAGVGSDLDDNDNEVQLAILVHSPPADQLEALRNQVGSCPKCGFIAWKDRNRDTADCQYCKLAAELERERG